MPELRRDPILDRWVIISSERINRPSDYRQPRERSSAGGFCPFCSGNEYTTPPEILAFREKGAPNSRGWSLRVVPNKFPALTIEGSTDISGDGLFRTMNGVGAHEVIIETPDHDRTLANLPIATVADVLEAFRSRLVDLKRDGRLEYVLIFKNHGPEAGATLEHSHSQLIALPVVPTHVQEEIQGSLAHFRATGRCVYCDIIAGERTAGERIIEESGSFIAFAPFASPSSFETWIVPKEHSDRFESSRDHYDELAGILQGILSRMNTVLGDPDYNFVLHTAPLKQEGTPHYHWHIEIRPQLNRIAGFEWGSGFFINPIPPEQAAAFLREGNGQR